MRCRSRSQNLGSVHSGKRLLGERHPAPPVKEDPEDLLRALRTAMAAAALPSGSDRAERKALLAPERHLPLYQEVLSYFPRRFILRQMKPGTIFMIHTTRCQRQSMMASGRRLITAR